MEFTGTDEQAELRSTGRRMLAVHAPISRARELAELGQRRDPALWRRLVEQIDLLGLTIPEDLGGSGASASDLAVVCEEMGRVLLGGPFFSTAVLATEALLACAPGDARDGLLGDIASGSATVALGVVERDGQWDERSVTATATGTGDDVRLTGEKTPVLDGAGADRLLIVARGQGGLSLYAVDPSASGVERRPLAVLDWTRQMAHIVLRDAPARLIGEDGAGWAAVDHVLVAASIQLAAEQVGASEACLEMTAEYARTRRQFGRTIGSYQAVKHRLADMAVRLELARSAAAWAAFQASGSPDQLMGAAVARSYCSEAFLQTAEDTIQLHGGIGFTWEHDAHLFARRARADFSLLGDPIAHRRRLITFLELSGPVAGGPPGFSEADA